MKRITESQINFLAKKIVNEKNYGQIKNYMFFSNLEQIIRQAQLLLELDPMEIEQILCDGHDWADDHITVAKENLDQVFDFMMNETQHNDYESEDHMMDYEEDEEMIMMESELSEKKKKNTPTNPKLWQSSLAWAKSRYKVCPSAYCNGAAVKRYNSKGGKWKKK